MTNRYRFTNLLALEHEHTTRRSHHHWPPLQSRGSQGCLHKPPVRFLAPLQHENGNRSATPLVPGGAPSTQSPGGGIPRLLEHVLQDPALPHPAHHGRPGLLGKGHPTGAEPLRWNGICRPSAVRPHGLKIGQASCRVPQNLAPSPISSSGPWSDSYRPLPTWALCTTAAAASSSLGTPMTFACWRTLPETWKPSSYLPR